MYKVCGSCKKELPANLEFFATRKRNGKTEFQWQCRNCQKEYRRKHYLENKEKYIKKAKENNTKNAVEMRQLVLDYLKHNSCVRCGESNILVLEFDHLKDKKFNIAQLANKWKEELLAEMAKCQVLCANCHKIKTHEQRNTYKWRYSQEIRQDSAKIPNAGLIPAISST